MKIKSRLDSRRRRHLRLRNKIAGTAERPRMCVCVSGRHMYVQFVDDDRGVTLAAASTFSINTGGRNNVATAGELGKAAAARAQEKGIKRVVFDRGGNRYAGRVKALAEAACAAGLKL